MNININTLIKEALRDDRIKVYHGDNFGTKEITAKNMWLDGNSQEGIGIYFGTLDVANNYGKYISSALIYPKKYINSRAIGEDVLNFNQFVKLLKRLHIKDEESMYYYITDFIEITNIEDIEDEHIESLAKMTLRNEVRHIQIELVQRFDILSFVEAWNAEFPNVHGTIEPDNEFYAIVNTSVKLTPENFQ